MRMLFRDADVSRRVSALLSTAAICSLLIILPGCPRSDTNIRPASEAASGGSAGSGAVTVSWDKVMAEAFDLHFATTPGGEASGRTVPNAANPIRITDLAIGSTLYFAVTALNNKTASLRSQETAHTVTGSDDAIELSFDGRARPATLAWDDVEGAAGYNIYWRNISGVTRQNGIKIAGAKNPHDLHGLIPGVTYYFVVTAVGDSGSESGVSEEISHTAAQ